MKGLFIKDIALMKHNKRLLMIIFLTVLFLLMSGMNSSFLMGYMPFICCILTMGTISYDEYENGLPFLFTLPVSRAYLMIFMRRLKLTAQAKNSCLQM